MKVSKKKLCLGIVGTKEYRKPEWVSHMEELQAALKGNLTYLRESIILCIEYVITYIYS